MQMGLFWIREQNVKIELWISIFLIIIYVI